MASQRNDLGLYIRNGFKDLYKARTTMSNVEQRALELGKHRKSTRNQQTMSNRNISVVKSPGKPAPKTKSSRRSLLVKWKAEKAEKIAREKLKAKPVFKVSKMVNPVGFALAPLNHTFKPPSNVKPIYFQNDKVATTKTSKGNAQSFTEGVVTRARSRAQKPLKNTVPDVKKKAENPKVDVAPESTLPRTQNNTRKTPRADSKDPSTRNVTKPKKKKTQMPKVVVAPDLTLPVPQKNTRKSPRTKSKDPITKKVTDHRGKINTKKPKIAVTPDSVLHLDSPEAIDVENKAQETPTKSSQAADSPVKSECPMYISPFVTISRGKHSARKEYLTKQVMKDDPTSPLSGCKYFTYKLDREVDRLEILCQQWQQYKVKEGVSEETESMIDVVIGQTNLLITKKFQQFRGLIQQCQSNDSQQLVTCEDLHGFWDMLSIQINNLDQRFENLIRLRGNNWEEILPQPKTIAPVNRAKKPVKSAASSTLRAAIQAARKKNGLSNKTPVKNSPGLAVMCVSQFGKGFDTPGRSILKKSSAEKSTSKTVLFVNNTENDANKSNLQSSSKGRQTPGKEPKTPVRASARLQKKLFE